MFKYFSIGIKMGLNSYPNEMIQWKLLYKSVKRIGLLG